MDTKCPYCEATLAPDLFHDHYEKCRVVTNVMQQHRLYQSPSPDKHTWPSRTPAYSESSPNNTLYSDQAWRCNCCGLNLTDRKQFQEHLATAEHKLALNSTTNGGFRGYQNSDQLSNDLMETLTKQQLGVGSHSPPTQPQINKGAPWHHQLSEEEIRSIVRSEMTKYLRQLLRTIENDIGKNPT